MESMGQTYSRLASVITDGVRSGKEQIMSKCKLCECREYCEWRLDSEKSCDDIKAEFEQLKGADNEASD